MRRLSKRPAKNRRDDSGDVAIRPRSSRIKEIMTSRRGPSVMGAPRGIRAAASGSHGALSPRAITAGAEAARAVFGGRRWVHPDFVWFLPALPIYCPIGGTMCPARQALGVSHVIDRLAIRP